MISPVAVTVGVVAVLLIALATSMYWALGLWNDNLHGEDENGSD